VYGGDRDVELGGRGALVSFRNSAGSSSYILQPLNGGRSDRHLQPLCWRCLRCYFYRPTAGERYGRRSHTGSQDLQKM
jgi:hypothetical protein